MAGSGRAGGRQPRPLPKGRAVDPRALEEVRGMLGDLPRHRDLLIEHLHRIQDTAGCLSVAHLAALAEELGLAQAEVYEVASFYHHFDIVRDGELPPAPLTVRVCDSISCSLAGAEQLLGQLRERLGRDVRVLRAPCIGRCERAPAVLVGQHAVDRATSEAVEAVARAGESAPTIPSYQDLADYRRAGGYRILASCVSGERNVEEVTAEIAASGERDVEDVASDVEASGLRGLGGAGFPTARKWSFVRQQPPPHLLALNADEGEPGTFKDRVLLESTPHRVLEGMLIAAWVVGATDCYIYLRDEYPAARLILLRELEALKSQAVIARGYALLKRSNPAHMHYGYDICSDQDCQVYGGVIKEQAKTTSAVIATRGEALYYQDRLAGSVRTWWAGRMTTPSISVLKRPTMPSLGTAGTLENRSRSVEYDSKKTSCPMVFTQCTPTFAPTSCPIEETRCPRVETKCPPLETRCPVVDTKCPPALTKCPPKETACPAHSATS